MIHYGKQNINQNDIDAVVAVLQSNWLTQGETVSQFETAIASYTGANYCVATNSATSALHLACLALDVKEGDQVWTPPITFVASANRALYCGAQVDFVDVDSNTGNICPQALEDKLIHASRCNMLPKVVILVHLCGHSCDMAAIYNLSLKYGFRIIEDASHALGSDYQGSIVGGCQYADISIFSFHPVKIITTAEGGVATTNDKKLATKLAQYRSHGINRDRELLHSPDEGEWYYEQQSLGFNYRMTELQAALGLSQLACLNDFISQRNILANYYHHLLINFPISIVSPLNNCKSAWHLQMIKFNQASIRKSVFDGLRQQGIQSHVHYFPVYLQPYYQNMGFKAGSCPQAEDFYQRILTLPLHPQMTTEDVDYIVTTLTELIAL